MQKLRTISLKKFVEWKEDILHLIFPSRCLICDKELVQIEDEICLFCRDELKVTNYENYQEATNLDKLFWGRVPLESTFALLYFEKEGGTQQILHNIKYKGKQELAKEMGKLIGEKLRDNSKYTSIDAFVPVPLHVKKMHLRGYNQSELLAKGAEEISQIPVNTDFLKRVVHSESQTKKGRFMRWDNIETAFQVDQKATFKHIALIDDVITTGSTIESCVREIHKIHPELKISVLSLAVTK